MDPFLCPWTCHIFACGEVAKFERIEREDEIGGTEDSVSRRVETRSLINKVLQSQQAVLVWYRGVE